MTAQVMKLEQLPIIKHKLMEMGVEVTKRIQDLNIEKQIASEDSIKTLKNLRADLNREAKEFEEQRKFIKNGIMNPYTEFEEVYKTEIIDKYKEASELLKKKINDFELSVKKQRQDSIEAYFEEVREHEELDWLKWNHLKIDINLSTSEKKYKEQVLEKVNQVLDDLELINTDKYAAEMLVEYKSTLNASNSIKVVRDRKQKEKEEKERILIDRTNKRKREVIALAFVYSDLTRTYNWIKDEQLMISLSKIENLEDSEWIKEFEELKLKSTIEDVKPIIKAPVVSAPVKEEKKEEKVEEIFEAKFSVKGTFSELKKLSEFLKSNNYKYENL